MSEPTPPRTMEDEFKSAHSSLASKLQRERKSAPMSWLWFSFAILLWLASGALVAYQQAGDFGYPTGSSFWLGAAFGSITNFLLMSILAVTPGYFIALPISKMLKLEKGTRSRETVVVLVVLALWWGLHIGLSAASPTGASGG